MKFGKRYIYGSFLLHISFFVLLTYVSFYDSVQERIDEIFYASSANIPRSSFKHKNLNVLKSKKIISQKEKKQRAQELQKQREARLALQKKKKEQQIKKITTQKKQPQKKSRVKALRANKEEKVKKEELVKNKIEKKEENKTGKKISQEKKNEVKQIESEAGKKESFDIVEEEHLTFNLTDNFEGQFNEYQKSIQETVSAVWRPPVGISKDVAATVDFMVNKNGQVREFEIIKEPKHLLFKLSIIRAAKKFKFKEYFWGKRFTIVFR